MAFKDLSLGSCEIGSMDTYKAVLAELISTFLFVFVGEGSSLAYSSMDTYKVVLAELISTFLFVFVGKGSSLAYSSMDTYKVVLAKLISTFLFIFVGEGSSLAYSSMDTYKVVLAELISTFLFVFVGEGSSLAYNKLTDNGSATPIGLLIAAICHGFAIYAFISIALHTSGGHVNPAVSLGLFVGGYISFVKFILYSIGQLVGAVLGSFLLVYVTNGEMQALPVHALAMGEPALAALVLEIVLTFGLLYTIYATAVDPRTTSTSSILFGKMPLIVGLYVTAAILFGGPFDGASMNPARSFGPAFVASQWTSHWVYWVGPLLGGALAGIFYEVVYIPHPSPQSNSHRQPLLSDD